MSSRIIKRKASAVTTAAIFFLVLAVSLACMSCGSGKDGGKDEKTSPVNQEENAQSLGRIMAHRNQLQGELNEPVDAVITGDVSAMAEAGEETWALIKVAGIRCTSVPEDTLKAAPGSELSVRLRMTEGAPRLAVGDKVEINARISKSTEGPVIIGRAYRVL